MSREQQESQVITNHHEGEAKGGTCFRMAEVLVETRNDLTPGPRAYCRPCAIRWLATGK